MNDIVNDWVNSLRVLGQAEGKSTILLLLLSNKSFPLFPLFACYYIVIRLVAADSTFPESLIKELMMRPDEFALTVLRVGDKGGIKHTSIMRMLKVSAKV